jgi:DNA ligase-1
MISTYLVADEAPQIQQAKNFVSQPIHIKEYWLSEKLDGIRGYWNGKYLVSKNGNIIHTPSYFTKHWPNQALDGELWLKRNSFEKTLSCVSTIEPNSCWDNIRFMVFDLPAHIGNFSTRINKMKEIINASNSPHLKMIKQTRVASLAEMYSILEQLTNEHAEGLMLHHGNATYKSGRQEHLLKVKKRHDAEAQVIAHHPGKGKYKGMLGSIKVITPDNLTFNIGTGFSIKERQNPPAIGTIITYQYLGKTRNGIPRFASFLRTKKQP